MTRSERKRADLAYGYALTRLALNLYTRFEELCESRKAREKDPASVTDERTEEDLASFMEILGRYLEGQEKDTEEIDGLRERLRERMETAVAYSEAFLNYEYVLTRIRGRFEKWNLEEVPDPELLIHNLTRYLADSEDSGTMNQRLLEIVSLLPVRFTRQKFFGMVQDALMIYVGGDYVGLTYMLYLMRNCSMVNLTEEVRSREPRLDEILKELEAVSFREMTAEGFRQARSRIGLASDMLMDLRGDTDQLEQMVNDLYLLLLTGGEASHKGKGQEEASRILREVGNRYREGKLEIPDEMEELLLLLEGVQEDYYEEYQRLEPAASVHLVGDEAEILSEKVDILMSSSSFAPFEGEAPRTVERADVEREVKAFADQLTPVLARYQKPLARAVMAACLSCLSMSFQSVDEVRERIRNSLDCCTDPVEKEACLVLLRQMMESDGYELV